MWVRGLRAGVEGVRGSGLEGLRFLRFPAFLRQSSRSRCFQEASSPTLPVFRQPMAWGWHFIGLGFRV